MPIKPKVIKHVTKEELEERYRKEKDSTIKESLLAILLLKQRMEEMKGRIPQNDKRSC